MSVDGMLGTISHTSRSLQLLPAIRYDGPRNGLAAWCCQGYGRLMSFEQNVKKQNATNNKKEIQLLILKTGNDCTTLFSKSNSRDFG